MAKSFADLSSSELSAISLPATFSSIAELKEAHSLLLKLSKAEELDSTFLSRIRDFIARTVALGGSLDNPDDRALAQGLIDYWASSYGAELRKSRDANSSSSPAQTLNLSETMLAPFDSETLRQLASSAESWALNLSNEDARGARRILLRLARLSPKDSTFELVPSSRAAMYDVDSSSERVNTMIDTLARLGVIRVKAGDTSDADQIWLRNQDLSQSWPTMTRWLNQRLSFRNQVNYWNAHDQPTNKLLKETDLDEARSYSDRNELERSFTEKSRYHELRQIEKNITRMRTFLGMAIVAIAVAAFAVWKTIEARQATIEARNLSESIKLGSLAQIISTQAIANMLMNENQKLMHPSKKILIVQSLRQILFAPDDDSRRIAKENWAELDRQLCEEPNNMAAWFTEFLHQDPIPGPGPDLAHQRRNIDAIMSATSTSPSLDNIDALQTVAKELKKYIISEEEARTAITMIRPMVLEQVNKVASELIRAAERRDNLSTAVAYRNGFWRLYSALLMVDVDRDYHYRPFAEALENWELANGVPSPQIVESLKKGAQQLSESTSQLPK